MAYIAMYHIRRDYHRKKVTAPYLENWGKVLLYTHNYTVRQEKRSVFLGHSIDHCEKIETEYVISSECCWDRAVWTYKNKSIVYGNRERKLLSTAF